MPCKIITNEKKYLPPPGYFYQRRLFSINCLSLNNTNLNTQPNLPFENHEGYQHLFNNAHDLIHFVHPDGRIIYVNHSWMNILGYTQEEIQGRQIESFVDDTDREKFLRYRANILNGRGNGERILMTMVSKNGTKLKIEGFISLQTKDNIPVYTTGIFRDVTKNHDDEVNLKRFNEQLRQSEFDLQQLLIHAPDAIIVIDPDGVIRFWNPKAEDIFMWRENEVVGQSLSSTIIPQQYRHMHDSGMKRYLATGEAHVLNKTIEITALKKNGEEFFVSLTISTTQQKGTLAFLAFIRDITLQKNNERELEKNRKALEKSNTELENFAHVASHDMKEPIRKIRYFSDRLDHELSEQLPNEGKVYLEKIKSAANRLTVMVEGVLNHSALTQVNQPLELIDLSQVIKNIITDLELMIKEKQGKIIYENLPPFEGMPFLIHQLFYNLLNNSLKFARGNVPAVIDITGKLLKDSEKQFYPALKPDISYVEIAIRDNGIGFDPSASEKIFQTFSRLHAKDQYEGTGLGLSLCKNIVERHRGFITAKAKENGGAVFTVVLPVKQ